MIRNTATLLTLLGALLLTGTASLAAGPSSDPPVKSFTYKKAKQANLEMVVHFPPGWKEADKRPAIVFFFGGGWQKGTIKQFEPQAVHLAGRGMVAARADYRVKSRQGVTPKECVEDAKSAVRWMRQNAATLGIDPERIVAAGGSAGGHIAACTALTPGLEAEGEDAQVSSKPNALVLFNPVLRFEGIPQLMERIGNDEALGKAISPTLHLTRDSPPTLIFFGTADRLAPMGTEFIKRSDELGHRAEIFTAEGQPHGFFNRPQWQEKTTRRMDHFLKSLGYLEDEAEEAEPSDAGSGGKEPSEQIAGLQTEGFPLIDFHVHLKGGLTLDDVLAHSRRTGIKCGIAPNCGLGFPITTDAGIYQFLESTKGQPVYVGMQAEGREWVKLFSPEAVEKFDYIFTDAMTFTDDKGKRVRLWIKEEVQIDDKQAFMEMYVDRILSVLNEPIDIYANPTFLPECIATEYDALWTKERMQKVIDAAVKNQVAIEINARYRLPSPAFIKLAEKSGVKFAFGTNNSGPGDLGTLDYCLEMIDECGLTAKDMFVPN
jgi:acetyl esterase/lipase